MNYRNRPLVPLALAIASLGFAATAPAVEVTLTAEPPGPLSVGEEVTIRLSVNTWAPDDPQVDAIAFNVDFDTAIFEFVAGSGTTLADGSEFLALPSQGGGYNLGDDSSEALVGFGRYIFGAADTGEGTSGSLGPDGFVGSFRLRAIAEGTGSVEPTASNPKLVFSDPEFFGIDPSGGVVLNTVDLVVGSMPGVSYPVWVAGIPFADKQDALPGSDPDCDGRVNALEYFLGADPLAPDLERSPQAGRVEIGGRHYTTLTYERPTGAIERTDARDRGQRSTDLKTWDPSGVVIENVGSPDPATGRETVVLRSTVAHQTARREFLRLLVELGL